MILLASPEGRIAPEGRNGAEHVRIIMAFRFFSSARDLEPIVRNLEAMTLLPYMLHL